MNNPERKIIYDNQYRETFGMSNLFEQSSAKELFQGIPYMGNETSLKAEMENQRA